jgi:hypothetical protein
VVTAGGGEAVVTAAEPPHGSSGTFRGRPR